jgi:hypothetical protein
MKLMIVVLTALLMSSCTMRIAAPTKPTNSVGQPPAITPVPTTQPGLVGTSVDGGTSANLQTGTSAEPGFITPADDGKTIQIHVGDSITLRLGEDFNWNSIDVSDQQVLSRRINVMMIRGAQGIYEAHAVGTVELNATGTPVCDPSQPCPAIARVFHVTIVVR